MGWYRGDSHDTQRVCTVVQAPSHHSFDEVEGEEIFPPSLSKAGEAGVEGSNCEQRG